MVTLAGVACAPLSPGMSLAMEPATLPP
jgi:hypothetical protein